MGPEDDNDSIAPILFALDSGVNWIDTAAVYGLGGHAEQIVGRAIREARSKPIIATKYGQTPRQARKGIPLFEEGKCPS